MNDWHDAEQHIEKAHQAFEDGRWAEAEDALREALALNPYRAEWHFNLGLTLEAAGKFLDASRAFIDCHQLDEEDAEVLLRIGVSSLRGGKLRESIPWFEKASAADPQNVEPIVCRIEAFARLGDHEQAEVMFYLAQQCDPKNADAYALLADSLMARGLFDKAVWCLREAANIDPDMPQIHARLAQAYAATGRFERARQLYLRELRSEPGDIDTLLDLGCLLVDMNRLPEAGEKFRRVLELESDNPHAHFFLADLSDRQGQVDQALEQLGVVLRLDGGYAPARRRAASLLLRRGRPEDLSPAKELLAQELEDFNQDPVRLSPEDLADLGRTLLEAGRADQAKRVLARLAAAKPSEPRALHLYSVALFELGERSAGIEQCRRVLKLDPKYIPAMHNIAIAYVFDGQHAKARYWVRQALLVDPDDGALRRLRLQLAMHRLIEGADVLFAPFRWLLSRRRRSA